MNALSDVPDDFDDFLVWFKERCETAWASTKTKTLEDFNYEGVGGSSWRTGTKWQPGLSEAEIQAIEQRWSMQFPADYRRFLAILNAPDRGMFSTGWRDDPPYDLQEVEDEPSFFDWQKDEGDITGALEWPLEGLLFDVEESALWPDSWGEKPKSTEDIRHKVTQLVAAAPKLVPLTGHRYLLGGSLEAGNPVLSVWQSDIIIYGSNLREFLLLELSDLLELDHDEIVEHSNAGITEKQIAAIPFWGELMLQD